MRVLLVGTGSIGRRHLENLRYLLGKIIVDVVREGSRATTHCVDDLGEDATVFHDLEKAIALKPDLMVIANPSALHLRYLVAAIEAGIPFYAEKPILTTLADLDSLRKHISLATGGVPINIIGCNLRFLPSLRIFRNIICSGKLGRIVRASFEAGQWLPDWRPLSNYRESYSAKRSLGGGVTLDLIHEVDAARWILGEFSRVHGESWKGSSLEIETEDCVSLLMKAENGPLVSVQLDYVCRQPVRRYRVVGDLGTLEWDLIDRKILLITESEKRELPLEMSDFDVKQTYLSAMSELLQSVQKGVPTSQPLEEGMRSLELVLRAKAQSSFGL